MFWDQDSLDLKRWAKKKKKNDQTNICSALLLNQTACKHHSYSSSSSLSLEAEVLTKQEKHKKVLLELFGRLTANTDLCLDFPLTIWYLQRFESLFLHIPNNLLG